ncbi:GNAT family N-acetyltransferase [Streptomyces shenzhenensis]|uniref:GNAT family N-acetyltransferase n=1 Tax=Streptomyces shenzhenensis TaxID=943815 RepID=A0A3M0HXE7_9ACTN|nr:GNAT family N-acetyltransferase [Streptomyces shenzhenensis]RMB80730.1 GNAT family N-acetyltransferase [Streptomyces shenzhenensis]
MTASEVAAPTFAQFTRPSELSGARRRDLAACWAAVVNAGGAVIPADCPLPPLTPADVEAAVDRIAESLAPECRLLAATLDGELAGWLLVRRETHPLEAHCGVVNHVQTQVHFRGLGIGTALMHRVHRIARDEMGLERLKLSARAGLGLEHFYRRAGWAEIGRWPGALRLAPGDDRDEILMSLAL